MASITIRNLDEETKRRLRIRAAEHGRSLEEEARLVIAASVRDTTQGRSLAEAIRYIVEPLGGIELELPERGEPRVLPNFEDPASNK